MATEITVPRLGWTMEEGVFVGWLKRDGDAVRDGEPLFTLESDKAAQEIEATGGGILRIATDGPEPGGTVRVGALLGWLAAEGEDVNVLRSASEVQDSTSDDQNPMLQPDEEIAVFEAHRIATVAAPTISAGAVTISPRAARTAAAMGVDLRTVRGTGRSGRIRECDVLAAARR